LLSGHFPAAHRFSEASPSPFVQVYNKEAAAAKDKYLATLAKYNASKPAEEPKADKKKKGKK